MELRLLRPKNAELKALDSHYLPETEGLHRKYRQFFSLARNDSHIKTNYDIFAERNNRIDQLEKLMTSVHLKSDESVPVECVKHVYNLYQRVK